MREWISQDDPRWVMRCDIERPNGSRCTNTGEPSPWQPSLSEYARKGWFIAELSGDVCPDCLGKGYQPGVKPHSVMRSAGVL